MSITQAQRRCAEIASLSVVLRSIIMTRATLPPRPGAPAGVKPRAAVPEDLAARAAAIAAKLCADYDAMLAAQRRAEQRHGDSHRPEPRRRGSPP
jgi:hypothetical protein